MLICKWVFAIGAARGRGIDWLIPPGVFQPCGFTPHFPPERVYAVNYITLCWTVTVDWIWHLETALVNLKYINMDNLNLKIIFRNVFLPWGGLLAGAQYNQAWVCNLKSKTEYEKYKILCSFFFYKLMFIERAGGLSQGKTDCERDIVRLLAFSVGPSLLNWCGFQIKS